MNVSIRNLLACAILLTIAGYTQAEYDVDAYCTLVTDGTKLASIENCQTYYTCKNGRAIKGTCPATQAFDKNQEDCRPKSDVSCYFGVNEPCLGKSESFVPVIGTCNGYIYCVNGKEKGRGVCPIKMIFSPTTKDGSCIYGICNDNINGGNTNDGLTSVCEIMPKNQFFGSTKDCQIWQICGDKGLTSKPCPKGYVFDVQIRECNHANANLCSRVTGHDIQPDPPQLEPCDSGEKDNLKADSSICSRYYKCDGTHWRIVSCAKGFYYDTLDNRCKVRQEATPADDCNRCEFTNKQFVNAVDGDCLKYQYCKNGLVHSRGKCDPDHYFDEASQACIIGTADLNNYRQHNGACHLKPKIPCPQTCGLLNGADCKQTGDCLCALESNVCKVDCDGTCSALAKDKCVATEGCTCGLDAAAAKCEKCTGAVDANGKCDNTVQPADCLVDCPKLQGADCKATADCYCAADAGNCKVDCVETCKNLGKTDCTKKWGCDCGLDAAGAVCELCTTGVEADGKCKVSPPPTCAATCAAATPCANSGDCFCADNAGTCEEDCVATCGSMGQDKCVNKGGCTCTSDGTTCKKA